MTTTIILTTDEVRARLFELLANQKTPQFVSIKNYRNDQGEVSDYIINIGTDYGKAKEKDAETLKDVSNLKDIEFGIVKDYSEEARIALLTALVNPTQATLNRSFGQENAYMTICENVRIHLETGRLFVYGMRVTKTVKVPGVYKHVNSKPLTIAKEKIRNILKATKFREFGMDKIVEIRLQGETLEFDLE